LVIGTNRLALNTGITGQDGSYLEELLLDIEDKMHGIKKISSTFNTSRIDSTYKDPHDNNRKFIELCALKLGWNRNTKDKEGIIWEGSGINEVGKRSDTGEIVVRIDSRYFRPTEVEELLGDSSKIEKKFGWKPKISLNHLSSEIIEEDLKKAKKETLLKNKGFNVTGPKE